MSQTSRNPEGSAQGPAKAAEYVVVARRYRPQTFEELVGQEHIARALSNAISTHRVGHAYLFTGARGVGKTSAARIFAKALNCTTGPAPVPCNACDICQSISSGDDVDVMEVDGASNRGIDEIRQLRQNVNVRPSRERFKIYIIDEVHMLTREAFNALLKTLEEPPEHVKFIFCTTEPGKIPITILSRCQRFDFAGIQTPSITERLRQIVEAEGVAAEPDALELLARRAAGSMRDSQSLLEQLLAFAPERITVADVNGMLGTAGEERLAALIDRIVARDAAGALADLDGAAHEGIDLGQLIEQLLGYLRDCMLAAVGCPGEMFLHVSPAGRPKILEAGKHFGLETVLAAMQILDQTLARLRYSTQGRILAELALVRLCALEELAELSTLIAQLQSGTLPAPPAAPGPIAAPAGPIPPVKKKSELTAAVPVEGPANESTAAPSPQVSAVKIPFTAENAADLWARAVARMPGLVVENAKYVASIAISAPNRLVVSFKTGYTFSRSVCERPEQKNRFEQALADLTGQRIVVEFAVMEDARPAAESSAPATRGITPQQRLMQVSQHSMIRRAMELFGAQPDRVDPPSSS